RIVVGDGSSRVVLDRAGIGEADALIAATNDDAVNLEICRIAREAGIHRVVALAADPERLHDYRSMDVPAFSPDSLTARRIEESVESRRISSQSFANGRAEVIEFEVTHSSPVHGKPLKDLRARSWVVGAVLRGETLLIPHGDTVLEPGDLVTVMGSGADFSEIVRTFTSGEARFPLDFGKSVVLSVDDDLPGLLEESSHLVRNSRAASLLLVHRELSAIRAEDELNRVQSKLEMVSAKVEGVEIRRRPVTGKPSRHLARVAADDSVGVFVRAPGTRRPLLSLWGAHRSVALARRTGRPVLIARGTQPYGQIVLPARRTAAGRIAAHAALDLAVQGSAELHAVAAVDPLFLAGPEAAQEARQAIGWLREEAAVLGLGLKSSVQRGNPARIFLEAARSADLLVLGLTRNPHGRFQHSITDHLASRATCSVLLVPTAE
ncbi:MAG: NAD-binding protein, partial [Candidatus Eisenbacteria bacterium]|nr:NAD-binding protein [Candidatus Eisenbacteria bacterium]